MYEGKVKPNVEDRSISEAIRNDPKARRYAMAVGALAVILMIVVIVRIVS